MAASNVPMRANRSSPKAPNPLDMLVDVLSDVLLYAVYVRPERWRHSEKTRHHVIHVHPFSLFALVLYISFYTWTLLDCLGDSSRTDRELWHWMLLACDPHWPTTSGGISLKWRWDPKGGRIIIDFWKGLTCRERCIALNFWPASQLLSECCSMLQCRASKLKWLHVAWVAWECNGSSGHTYVMSCKCVCEDDVL